MPAGALALPSELSSPRLAPGRVGLVAKASGSVDTEAGSSLCFQELEPAWLGVLRGRLGSGGGAALGSGLPRPRSGAGSEGLNKERSGSEAGAWRGGVKGAGLDWEASTAWSQRSQGSEGLPLGAGTGGTQDPADMDNLEELESTAQEVLGRLKSRHLFQSQWDIGAFVIFLIFVGECGLCIWPLSPSCQVPG